MNFRQLFPSEHDDESIFVFTRPYYLAFLPWLAIGVALLIIGVVFVILIFLGFTDLVGTGLGYNVFIVISSAYFLMLIPFLTVAFIDFYYDIHIVTDRRLVDINQKSLFAREINELALEDVQDVTTKNTGISSSFFDFGDVEIETSGAVSNKFVFNSVLHPRDIAAIILDLSEQAKQRLEHGDLVVQPRGETKGIIGGQVFHSTQPLEEMGAVINAADPSSPAGSSAPASANNEPDLDIVIDPPPPK